MYDVKKGYEIAKEYYARYGVDVDSALKIADETPISLHCWQGDDVQGTERKEDKALSGGIQTTGNYPGKAINGFQLRADMLEAIKFIPGKLKLNIHANYIEADKYIERDEIKPEHYDKWVEFAVENGLGLDFNPTYFAHPLSTSKGTLSCADEKIRKFWVRHGIACRRIGEYFAEKTGIACVINHWTPDGDKEFPIDALSPRMRLKQSYDEIFEATKDVKNVIDGIESKVFGIGAESYTVGSHEFCMGYVMKANKDHIIMTLDDGHYHPTETVSNKLSGIFTFANSVLLHVTRAVRWDSDHVVGFDDETKAIFEELVRMDKLSDTYVATDFFDASINRVAAWIIGLRNTRKAILSALLQPNTKMRQIESAGDVTARLALKEEFKAAPFALVWDYYCDNTGKGLGLDWLGEIKKYEQDVQLKR